jgi:hypothetical protein
MRLEEVSTLCPQASPDRRDEECGDQHSGSKKSEEENGFSQALLGKQKVGEQRALKKDRLQRQDLGSYKAHKGSGGEQGTETVHVAGQGREQKTCDDDVEDHKHEEGAVKAPCEVDHPIKRQEIQGDLNVGKGGEGPYFMPFGSVQSPPSGAENKVVEENAESNEGDGKDGEFGFQEVESPGPCRCSSYGEPANSDEPVDPFYEFLSEKQLLLD